MGNRRASVAISTLLKELGVAKGNVQGLIRGGYVTIGGERVPPGTKHVDVEKHRGEFIEILGRQHRLGSPLATEEGDG